MGWLSRWIRTEPKGIRLDTSQPFWELEGKTDFPHLLRALGDLLPQGSVLYFEGGSPTRALRRFLNAHRMPEHTQVAVGILWPRPTRYHVAATAENLNELARLTASCQTPEVAIHFHVYHHGEVQLEWHDAFWEPLLVSGALQESRVKAFAQILAMSVRRREP